MELKQISVMLAALDSSLLKGASVHRKNAFNPFFAWLQIQEHSALVVVGNPLNGVMEVCTLVTPVSPIWSFC